MESRRLVGDRFRQRLRDERLQRRWSQADLAERLKVHPTTVAKIEGGSRAVSIAEAAQIADLFDLSLDAMLERNADPRRDLAYALQNLRATVTSSIWQITAMHVSISERVANLTHFDFGGRDHLESVADQAYSALNQAHLALEQLLEVGPPPDAE